MTGEELRLFYRILNKTAFLLILAAGLASVAACRRLTRKGACGSLLYKQDKGASCLPQKQARDFGIFAFERGRV